MKTAVAIWLMLALSFYVQFTKWHGDTTCMDSGLRLNEIMLVLAHLTTALRLLRLFIMSAKGSV